MMLRPQQARSLDYTSRGLACPPVQLTNGEKLCSLQGGLETSTWPRPEPIAHRKQAPVSAQQMK